MERAEQLTLEPYKEQDGHLGRQMDVNEEVSRRVFERLDLREKVLVFKNTKEDPADLKPKTADPATLLDSEHIREPFIETPLLKSVTVKRTGEGWEVEIDDNEVHRKVDASMVNYDKDEGRDSKWVYRQRFVRMLSDDVAKGISKASRKERNQRFLKTAENSVINGSMIGASLALTVFGFESMSNYGDDLIRNMLDPENQSYVKERVQTGLGIAGTVTGISAFIYLANNPEFARAYMNNRESAFPNPQLRSRIQGAIELKRNRHNLLMLNGNA